MATATFAAGCFWGVEAAFRQIEGVTRTEVGYSGGQTDEPSYSDVCTGTTGHAEVVRIEFDAARVNYDELLEVFWNSHDPTQLNRQGPDVGTQYRSAIHTHDDGQQAAAEASKENAQERFGGRIVTNITAASEFWRAEEYHQQYLAKRGQDACATTVRPD